MLVACCPVPRDGCYGEETREIARGHRDLQNCLVTGAPAPQREGEEEVNDPEAIRTTVPGRFPLPMLEEWPEVLKHASFHRQFIALTRAHAQLIRNDTFVFDLFDRHCFKAIEGWGAADPRP